MHKYCVIITISTTCYSPTFVRAGSAQVYIHRLCLVDSHRGWKEFNHSFQLFTAQRSHLLARLELLAPEDSLGVAKVVGAGEPLERTVKFYAQWLATHERPHLKQIERIAKTMHLQ